MKGRSTFTVAEAEAVRALPVELRSTDRGTQKRIRRTLRTRYQFYISDFAVHREGFTVTDLDFMIRRAVIRIEG